MFFLFLTHFIFIFHYITSYKIIQNFKLICQEFYWEWPNSLKRKTILSKVCKLIKLFHLGCFLRAYSNPFHIYWFFLIVLCAIVFFFVSYYCKCCIWFLRNRDSISPWLQLPLSFLKWICFFDKKKINLSVTHDPFYYLFITCINSFS